MPTLLKQRTDSSPGIITFTHNETLNGVPVKSIRIRNFLNEQSAAGKWIFGVHVQGDCSHMKQWPIQDWHQFVMWPDTDAPFLRGIPKDRLFPLTCINFMPNYMGQMNEKVKKWDVCIISRASDIKRIQETLLVVRDLMNRRPDFRAVFIVPDIRRQSLGDKAYKVQEVDRSYFELPKKIFSCEDLKRLSFISSSQSSFGVFPLESELVSDILIQSKFLFLPSHKEGVPRVIAEALLVGTPCIVSRNLKSGITDVLNPKNSIFISDDVQTASDEIIGALERYKNFEVDRSAARKLFSEENNLPAIRNFLSDLILKKGQVVEGAWFLEELFLRLACHGQKNNFQIMNRDEAFFDWFQKIEKAGNINPTEDYLFGTGLQDKPIFWRDTPVFKLSKWKQAASKLKRKILSF